MEGREKVEKGLECCRRTDGTECKNCPYQGSLDCVEELVVDVIDLLKVQPKRETTKPQIHNSSADVWYYICEDCEYPISPGDHYCGNCGKRIIWGSFVQS